VEGVYLWKLLASGAPAGGGAPVIPERYQDFYGKGPIRARVVCLNEGGTVHLATESRDRLEVGMWLTTGRYSRVHIELQVTSMNDHGAVGQPYYSRWSEEPVAEGDEFTTGLGWNFPILTARDRLTEPAPPRPRITILHKDTREVLTSIYVPGDGERLSLNSDLQGADLREAGPGSDAPLNLVGAWGWSACLQDAVMEGQTLARACLRRATLERANARNATLEETVLSEANLRSITLAGANLTGADLQNADLAGADLSDARLRWAVLRAADLRGADLTGADLQGADLTFVRFDGQTRWPAGIDPAAARRGPGLATRLKSYVAFHADESRLSAPARGSICTMLGRTLLELGFAVERCPFDARCNTPVRRRGRKRTMQNDSTDCFRCSERGLWLHVMIGAPGDRPLSEGREWLITVHPLPGLVSYLVTGRVEAACRTFCGRLDRLLKHDSRFRCIRWYTEAAWNAADETDWSEAP
jgi:hypothetical protein